MTPTDWIMVAVLVGLLVEPYRRSRRDPDARSVCEWQAQRDALARAARRARHG